MREYIPPMLSELSNGEASTECLPATIIDLSLWAKRLLELKKRTEESAVKNMGENPYMRTEELLLRLKLYGRRIKAELEMLNSDSTVKRWMPGELDGNLR